jgi:hypothetical protein
MGDEEIIAVISDCFAIRWVVGYWRFADCLEAFVASRGIPMALEGHCSCKRVWGMDQT